MVGVRAHGPTENPTQGIVIRINLPAGVPTPIVPANVTGVFGTTAIYSFTKKRPDPAVNFILPAKEKESMSTIAMKAVSMKISGMAMA